MVGLLLLTTPAQSLSVSIENTIPEYILEDHLNLTGTTNITEGCWTETTNAHFSTGAVTNLTVADGAVTLRPEVSLSILNNGNAVLSGGGSSAWDRYIIDMDVIKVNGTYLMYYSAGTTYSTASGKFVLTSPYHIGLATSSDGINWTKYSGNPVIRSRVDSYDSTNVFFPIVMVENGTWRMWYAGNRGNQGGGRADVNVCYATSTDGENWTKHASNPVISNGAPNTAWNGLDIRPTSVVRDGTDLVMYLKASGVGTPSNLGGAKSDDGTSWTLLKDRSLYSGNATGWEDGVTNYGTLERANGTYRMWTHADRADWKVGWIWSRDGLDWEDSGAPILSPAANTIYSSACMYPRAIDEGDHYKLYVSCWDGNARRVGCFKAVPERLDGVYVSKRFDAGGPVVIGNLNWSAEILGGGSGNTTITDGGSVDLFVRWSNNTTSWNAWKHVTSGSDVAGTVARYFQYKSELRVERDWFRARLDEFNMTYTVPISSVEISVDGGPWQSTEGTFDTWSLNVSLHDGDYDILVRATDSIGDVKTETLPVKVDLFPPTGNITIEEGRYAHNSTNVLIDIEANDTHEPIQMQLSRQPDFAGASWTPLVTSEVWQLLGSPEGEVTIYLRLRDDAGRISETYNDSIVIDTTPPEGRLLINDGAKYSNSTVVTCQVEWTDLTGVVAMMVSNDPSFQGAIWQDPMNAFSWSLEEGDGNKTVYVRIRDFVGWETTLVDDIILDGTPPVASISIDQDAPFTTSLDVMLSITLYDENPIRFKLANSGDPWPEAWRTTASPVDLPWVLSQGEDGPRRVNMLVHDAADNEFTAHDDIVLDTTPPEGDLVLNDGEAFTNTLLANATLSASDATSGLDRMRISDSDDFKGVPWQTVKDTFLWTLTSGDGPKVIYVQLRDLAGLVSTIDATIYLDTKPPTGSLTINGGAMFTITTTVELSIDVEDPTGLSLMRMTNGVAFDGSSWMPFSPLHIWTLDDVEGERTVLVEVRDNAGNSVILNDSITLDLTDPHAEVDINNGQEATLNLTVFIEWDATDGNGIDRVGFSEDLVFESDEIIWLHPDDGIPIIQMPLEFTFSGTDGLMTVYMKTWDMAGRTTLVSDSIWYVSSRPEGGLTLGDGSGWSNVTEVKVTVEWTGGSEPTHYRVHPVEQGVPPPEWVPIGEETTITLVNEGPRSVRAELLGPHNVTSHYFYDTITLDLTPPEVTIVTPGRDMTESDTMLLNLSFQDNLDPEPVVRFSLNGGEWTLYDGTARLDLREGRNVISVEARDKAGNLAFVSQEVEYDVGLQVGGSTLVLLVLAIVVCLVVIWYFYNRSQRKPMENR